MNTQSDYTCTKVLYWNINGINKVYNNIELNEYFQNFHILCLTETWSNKNVPTIENFEIIVTEPARKDKCKRGRFSGGMMIFAKQRIKVKTFDTGVKTNGVIYIEVQLGTKNIILGCIYNPPSTSVYRNPIFFEKLEESAINLVYKNEAYAFIGDFNARTGCICEEEFFDPLSQHVTESIICKR